MLKPLGLRLTERQHELKLTSSQAGLVFVSGHAVQYLNEAMTITVQRLLHIQCFLQMTDQCTWLRKAL